MFVSDVVCVGRGIFNMGLTERHIKQFQGQRLYTTVVFENLPQLCLQVWYFVDRKDSDIVAILAFLSSVASVFLAFIDVYSSVSLLRVMFFCLLFFCDKLWMLRGVVYIYRQ